MATDPINWPTSPSDGDIYTSPNGDRWIYETDAWKSIGTTPVGFGATASTQCLNFSGANDGEAGFALNDQWYYGNGKMGWANNQWSDTSLGGDPVPAGQLQLNYYTERVMNGTKVPVAYHDWNGITSKDFMRICVVGYLSPSIGTIVADYKLHCATLGTTCEDMASITGKGKGNLRYCEDVDGTSFNTNGTICYYYDCPLDNFLTPAAEPFNVTWSNSKPYQNILFGAWKIKYQGEEKPENFGTFRWSYRIDYISAKGGSPA